MSNPVFQVIIFLVVSDVDPDPHYGWPDLDSGAKFKVIFLILL